MAQIIELAVKDIKISIMTVLYILRKVEEKFNMLFRDMKDIERTQTEFPEMKTILCEMKIH